MHKFIYHSTVVDILLSMRKLGVKIKTNNMLCNLTMKLHLNPISCEMFSDCICKTEVFRSDTIIFNYSSDFMYELEAEFLKFHSVRVRCLEGYFMPSDGITRSNISIRS